MGILGAPDVDWTIAIDGGRVDVAPGSVVRATVSFRPRESVTFRRVMAALVGTEEWQYTYRENRQSSSSSSKRWGSDELVRQEIQLLGPGTMAAGELRTGPVEFAMPADAAPSIETNIFKVRWKLVLWMDVGGRDAKFEQNLVVPLTIAQLDPGDAARMGEQVQTTSEGQPVTFWAQPAPLRVGGAFSGALDLSSALAAADTRIELKLTVSTQVSGGIAGATVLGLMGLDNTSEGGVTEAQVLWRGVLTPGGPTSGFNRYLFSGQLPLSPVVTAVYPHASAIATFDVVMGRRLRPDAHILRPVAIVSG